MSLEENLYLNKQAKNSNNIYLLLNEVANYYIFKEYDTLLDEIKIIAVDSLKKNQDFYPLESFLKNASYIGFNGFYKEMDELSKYIYEPLVLLYKNDYHELLYDTISEKIIVMASYYKKEDFTPLEKTAPPETIKYLKKLKNKTLGFSS